MTVRAVPAGRIGPLDRMWLLLPYPVLLATTLIAWTGGDLDGGRLPAALGVGAVLVAWHSWWTLAHPQWLERALAPMATYYAGLLALTTTLLALSFDYFALVLVSYPIAFVALPGSWAYLGIVLTSAMSLAVPQALTWSALNLIILVVSTALVAAAGWSIRALERETRARRTAQAELMRANEELERALAENVSLQDRLVAEARQAGVSAERARLAAEIHDTLAAALTGIVSQLEALDAGLPPEHPMRRRVLASIELARESLREARRSVQALRPAALSGRTLERALADLAESCQRTFALPVRLHLVGAPAEVPDDVEDALVRIAREALTNAGRHSGASEVHLTRSNLTQSLAVDIADDGTGFDTAGSAPARHGLEIMSERARAVGGSVTVTSDEAAGTTVTATIPVPGSAP